MNINEQKEKLVLMQIFKTKIKKQYNFHIEPFAILADLADYFISVLYNVIYNIYILIERYVC